MRFAAKLQFATRLTVIALALLAVSHGHARVQRMMVSAGTRLRLEAKGTSKIPARCVDPHLHPPVSSSEFRAFSTQTDAYVKFLNSGKEMRLQNAVANGDIQLTGHTKSVQDLTNDLTKRLMSEWKAARPHATADEEATANRLLRSLVESAAASSTELVGDFQNLNVRSNVNEPLEIEFRTPSVLAPSDLQAGNIDEIHRLFAGASASEGPEDIWQRRHISVLNRLEEGVGEPFTKHVNVSRLIEAQRRLGVEPTGKLDTETILALNHVLEAQEYFQRPTPTSGDILTLVSIRESDTPMYKVIDASSGLPIRNASHAVIETDDFARIRDVIRGRLSDTDTVTYVRAEGFTEQDVINLRSSLKLSNLRILSEDRRFFSRGAKILAISEPRKDETHGGFILQCEIEVESAHWTLKLKAKLKDTLTRISDRLKRQLTGKPDGPSIREAVDDARKMLKAASDNDWIEISDELSKSQFVDQTTIPSKVFTG